jgi:TM2 domain-containing membrane protein YozV
MLRFVAGATGRSVPNATIHKVSEDRLERQRSPAVAAFLSWLVPGAGHLYLGRGAKALFFFALITATYVGGMILADYRNVSPVRYPWWSLAYVCNAGTTLVAYLLTASLRITHEIAFEPLGCLYTGVASLLNVLVVLDAYGLADRIRHGEAAP